MPNLQGKDFLSFPFPVLKTLTFGYAFQRMNSARLFVSHLTCFPPNCHLFSLLLSGFGVRVCSFPFRGLSFLFHPAFRLSVRCVSPHLAFPSIFPALEKCTVPVRPFGLSVTIEYHVSPWLNIYFCCEHMDKTRNNSRIL